MKRVYIVFLLLTLSRVHANMWDQLFLEYTPYISNDSHQILLSQLNAYALNQAPAIADECIKSIPLVECGEELIDVSLQNHPRISVMCDHDLPLAHAHKDDIDYRSSKHALVRKSVYESLERMIDHLDRLAPHFGYDEGELCIKLFEGMRDLATQKIVFDKCLRDISQQNPSFTYAQAYTETCKWVSPYINNVPTHSTGAAIDIHIWSNKKQAFCNLGRFNAGEFTAPTFSIHELISIEQIKNRFLLLIAATEAGLINYVYEWWHFSLGDRYACYWNKSQRCAIYDAQ